MLVGVVFVSIAPCSMAIIRRPEVSYTTGLHAKAILKAYDQSLSDSYDTPLARLLAAYSPVMKKVTAGTCKSEPCFEDRGPMACLSGRCMCREGYETLNDETCVRHGPHQDRDQDRAHFTNSGASDELAGEAVKQGLQGGAGEPDNLPCPAADEEMAQQTFESLGGKRVYNVSLCRIAGQKYHGSPLPLATEDQLRLKPIANGYQGEDNLRHDLYSVHSFGQWRTSLVQTMSKQFMYATALADASEGARRLGNLFHLLSDTFCQSHVNRKEAAPDAVASREMCNNLTVTRPISMDVVNWFHHMEADATTDIYWHCATLYGKEALTVWAEARLEKVDSAASANKWIDKFVKEVACPALSIDSKDWDKPVGGADAYYGSDSVMGGSNRPLLPTGLAAAADSERLVQGWREALAAYRASLKGESQWLVPREVDLPPRGLDACTTLKANHVTDREVQNAIAGKIDPQYIVPLLPPKNQIMVKFMMGF